MQIDMQHSNGQWSIVIGGELTIYAAADMKSALIGALGECREMEIDLCAVSEIDSAGLQVLMLVKREAAAAGKAVRLVGHSRPVRELIELYSLATSFGDPLVIPAQERECGAGGGQ